MFRIIDLQQDTQQWLDWRMSGITATDASIIMGDNPYESVETLFLVKAGLQKAEFKMNDAIQRGKDLEPIVREKVNHHFQEEFQPACVQNLEHDFVLASLDGISTDKRILLEIKCPASFIGHRRNIQETPAYYLAQVDYQLLCTGAEYAVFASCLDNDIRYTYIYPDKKYHKEMLKKIKEFWLEVQSERLKNGYTTGDL